MAESKARNTDPRYSKLTIGVCPDQWGVWFPAGREADRLGRRARRDGDGRLLGDGDRPVRLLPDRAGAPPGGDGRSAASRSSPAPAGASCTRPRPGPTPRSSSAPSARRTPPSGAEYVVHLPPMFRDEKTRRLHRRQGALHRGLEPLHQERRQARADHEGGLRPEDGPAPARRQPHRDPRRHRPHLPGDRPRVRRLLPRHRPHRLRRRRPDGAVPQVPRAHLLRAHQGDGPGPGQAGPRRGLAVRHGRASRLLGRAAGRRCPTCATSSRRSPTSTRSSTWSASRTCTRCDPSYPLPNAIQTREYLASLGLGLAEPDEGVTDSDRPHRHDRPRRHGAGAHRPHPHRHRRRPRRRRQRRRPGARGGGRRADRRRRHTPTSAEPHREPTTSTP